MSIVTSSISPTTETINPMTEKIATRSGMNGEQSTTTSIRRRYKPKQVDKHAIERALSSNAPETIGPKSSDEESTQDSRSRSSRKFCADTTCHTRRSTSQGRQSQVARPYTSASGTRRKFGNMKPELMNYSRRNTSTNSGPATIADRSSFFTDSRKRIVSVTTIHHSPFSEETLFFAVPPVSPFSCSTVWFFSIFFHIVSLGCSLVLFFFPLVANTFGSACYLFNVWCYSWRHLHCREKYVCNTFFSFEWECVRGYPGLAWYPSLPCRHFSCRLLSCRPSRHYLVR